MNRWTGTAHLTRDPELVTTSGGTDICLMRIAVKRAARDGAAGYFDVKAFGVEQEPKDEDDWTEEDDAEFADIIEEIDELEDAADEPDEGEEDSDGVDDDTG